MNSIVFTHSPVLYSIEVQINVDIVLHESENSMLEYHVHMNDNELLAGYYRLTFAGNIVLIIIYKQIAS